MAVLKLESFRAVNCFGFADSGEIDLSEPGTLVYFLGRNSSGKTSVLRAISYLEYGLIPVEHPNFVNYEQPVDTPYIQDRYLIDAEGGADLSTTTLVDEVIESVRDAQLQVERDSDGYVVTPSQYARTRSIAALLNHVDEVYSNLIQRIRVGGKVRVDKFGSGEYQFYAEGDTFTDLRTRFDTINQRINSAKRAFNDEGRTFPQGLNFRFIEGLLFKQFPDIFVFTDRFKLDENLPRSLREEHLRGKQSALTDAFIEILGRDDVAVLLRASGMGRINSLREELQARLDKLSTSIT